MSTKNPILLAVVAPGKSVVLQRVPGEWATLQGLVNGDIEVFPTSIEGTAGLCNDVGRLRRLPQSRFNPATGDFILGTFLVVGDRDGRDGRVFCSLTREQVTEIFHLYGCVEGRELLDDEPEVTP